jgi:hypothetical protein
MTFSSVSSCPPPPANGCFLCSPGTSVPVAGGQGVGVLKVWCQGREGGTPSLGSQHSVHQVLPNGRGPSQ